MSIHDDLFTESVLPLQFELHGDTGRVTHTPAGGVASSLDATIGPERTVEVADDRGAHLECVREITIRTADAAPKKSDAITIADTQYAVRSVRSLGPDAAVVELVRRPASEIARRDLRGAR